MKRQTAVPAHGGFIQLSQSPRLTEQGQALLEGLIALLVLLSLWVAIAWLARFQDMALQASHASRFAAFSLTRNPDYQPIADVHQHYFSGTAHQWADRRGRQLLSPGRTEISLLINRSHVLSVNARPGGNVRDAMQLRSDWLVEDSGIVSAVVRAAPVSPSRSTPAGLDPLKLGLRYFDSSYPVMSRHTSILAGAGHASSDADTQLRVANSDLGWHASANQSYSLGRQIAERMENVDRAWDRPKPRFDWLDTWAGETPGHHLSPNPGGGYVRVGR
ncbi:MAG TPA: hypothetical protein VIP51_09925 [Eoetvoesiella sp.]